MLIKATIYESTIQYFGRVYTVLLLREQEAIVFSTDIEVVPLQCEAT